MRDVTTVVEPAPRAVPPRAVHHPVTLTPVRKLTRAHLALEERPALLEQARVLEHAVAGALSGALSTELTLHGRLADATLHPLAHLGRASVFVVVELNADGVAIIELESQAAGLFLHHVARPQQPMAAPLHLGRIEEAALGWLSLTAIAAARATPLGQRLRPRLLCVTADRAHALSLIDPRRRHLSVVVAIGPGGAGLRLLLPATWLETVLREQPAATDRGLDPVVAHATLEAECRAGLMLMSPGELASLAPRDVLVFPGLRVEGDRLAGPAHLLTRLFELRGTLSPAGFTLTLHTERPVMHHPDPTLPVEVEIELTRVRLPLLELAALKVGGVIPLHLGAAQTVVLRVGDRPVARAELVEVEGEVGARILSMFTTAES